MPETQNPEAGAAAPAALCWYRHPWILLVVSIPVMAIIMSLTTVYLAVSGQDTLVRDNFYKDGLAINQELDGEKRAQQLGITARIVVDDRAGQVTVQLSGYQDFPAQLELAILHPTRAEQDQDVVLTHGGNGLYTGVMHATTAGHYHLQLASAAQQWQLKGYRQLVPGQTLALP